jgi:pimeloyl-ACP methyl ester carboxylesterase
MQSSSPWSLAGALRETSSPSEAPPPAIAAEEKSFETAAAGRLTFYVDRTGTGRPLVLLHSINAAASSYEMKPLFEAFRRERPVYALDWPGFGRSGRDERAYDASTYRQALERFLTDEVEAEGGADVVALSLAGEFAAHVAVTLPALVHSLVLISPTGFGKKRAGSPAALRALSRHPLAARLLWAAVSSRPSIRYFLGKSFHGPVDRGLLDHEARTVRAEGAARAPLDFIAGLPFTPDIFEQTYERLRVPTLIVHDQDAYTSFERVPELVAEGHGVETRRLAPTRGLPQFETPGALKEALVTFWKERRPSHEPEALP